MLSDRCLSVLSVCLSVCLSVLSVTLVYCGQTVGWIKMKLGMRVNHRFPPPCQISPPSVQRQGCRTPKTEIFTQI